MKVLSFAYSYNYEDVLVIPLEDLDWIMEDAREVYKTKMIFYKAMSKFAGVKD